MSYDLLKTLDQGQLFPASKICNSNQNKHTFSYNILVFPQQTDVMYQLAAGLTQSIVNQ